MKINEAQKEVKRIMGDMEHPRLASFIALTEEVGELANEVMKNEIYDEKDNIDDLKAELADILICVLELANVYKFDLEKEFSEKLKDIEPRAEKWRTRLKDILKEKRDKHD